MRCLLPFFFLLGAACVTQPVRSHAFKISRQEDLIGGTSALGQVGDYMLQNGRVRVIIQDAGFSRGFGVYGGGIIDADIRRADTADGQGGHGSDRFAEMFPVFFLQAAKPTGIRIKNDGSDGKPAKIVVVAEGGPFLSQVTALNELALGRDGVAYEVEYSLGPNDAFVKMTSSMINFSGSSRRLRISAGALDLRVPFGTVALFGSSNRVFVPGRAGFDLRFVLPEEISAHPVTLPALPGLTADFIATKGEGVSYGVFAEPLAENNFAYANRHIYNAAGVDGVNEGSLQIPFFFSSFIGYYYAVGPEVLGNDETFSFTQYFTIGTGDVASVRDVFHQVRRMSTGTFAGRVRDAHTLRPAANVSVVVYDQDGLFFNQHTTDQNGDFKGTYPEGEYSYELVTDRAPIEARVPFSVRVGKTTGIEPLLPASSFLNVQVTDTLGRRLPAKIILVGIHDYPGGDEVDPRTFLFNLGRGERRRPVDQVPDLEGDPTTRRFIELQHWTHNGSMGAEVRPGRYMVYVSRGPEYEIELQPVDLEPGEQATVSVTLQRVVDTTGWVSGDMHLHSIKSIDSGVPLRERVAACAAEGLDFAIATDHNFIADYAPYVTELELEQFLLPIVGLEMTTLELGHFNGYPLNYDLASATHGSFSWFNRKAQEIFDDLRDLGKYGPDETVVQVNHARDTLLGYFSQLDIDPETMSSKSPFPAGAFVSQGEPFRPENWSFDFDALEIFNGKRWELLRTVQAPDPLPPPPYAYAEQKPGDILRYESGQIAYPGAVDDWFKLLNLGYRIAGVADSDSHGNTYEEPGYPRTFVQVGKDDPFELSDLEVTRAIKGRTGTMTNGPFVELWANGQPIGSEVSGTGEIDVQVRIQKPSWIDADTLVLYVNGAIDKTQQLRPGARDDTHTIHLSLTHDSWVVAEVRAREGRSLWPIVTGWEEPPLTLADAVTGIAGPLGIEFSTLGPLKLKLERPVYPYAITNPIWIDFEGDGAWTPPGNAAQAVRAAREAIGPRPPPPAPDDIRALFKLFGGHH